jgi:hypothetical protein
MLSMYVGKQKFQTKVIIAYIKFSTG